jgi:hypothetical protein
MSEVLNGMSKQFGWLQAPATNLKQFSLNHLKLWLQL